LAVGVMGGGLLRLNMRPEGGTSGCWRAGLRNSTFIYETGGRDFWLLAWWVERVSREVTPRVTLAGTASGLIQKEIQDMMTMRPVGGTFGCWRDGWRIITFIYETGGRDFWLLACWVEEYYLYI
jgi:hypothetical protein